MNPTVPGLTPDPWQEFEYPPEAIPDLSKLVTQDDTPVDSYLAEKQQRLLAGALYSSWSPPGESKTFLVQANVGYFYAYRLPPLVPDVMLTLDVEPAGELHTKEGHSYFQWLMGKPPEVIIEIVSDRRGGEEGLKMRQYARQGVPYYAIYDPEGHIGKQVLRAYVNAANTYEPITPPWFHKVSLGLVLWDGIFEGHTRVWLRWCDQESKVIPTGDENTERLREQLRALGIEPEA